MREYYPRIVGIAPQGETRNGEKWYELLVTGKDELGALSKLATLLAEY